MSATKSFEEVDNTCDIIGRHFQNVFYDKLPDTGVCLSVLNEFYFPNLDACIMIHGITNQITFQSV